MAGVEDHEGVARSRELPAGLADLLPEAAARFLHLRRKLLDVLWRWGYRPVLPPLLEHSEVFTRALAEPADEASIYKLVDRATGHVLAIRTDFTPQVARMAAGRFQDALMPLRLAYEGAVVRHVPAQKGRSRQIQQLGAELLGVAGPEGDAEAVALVVAGLQETGVEDFKVDLGQVEFFKGILRGEDLSSEDAARLTDCVGRKDLSDLERLLGTLPLTDRKKRLLAELPLLAGGADVIERADSLAESDHSRRALENLADVLRLLSAHGVEDRVTVDLGELRGVDYHTGVIFEAFVHHLGSALCRGGRYDGLLAKYGADTPATGFSLDLLALMEALRVQGKPAVQSFPEGVLIVDRLSARARALPLAQRLRASGMRAAIDLADRPVGQSLVYGREQGFLWVAAPETEPAGAGEVLLVHLPSGAESILPLDDVVRCVAAEE